MLKGFRGQENDGITGILPQREVGYSAMLDVSSTEIEGARNRKGENEKKTVRM